MTAHEAGAIRADNDNTPVFDRGRERPVAFLDDIAAQDTDDTPTGVGRLSSPVSAQAAKARRQAEKAAMLLARADIAARQGKGDPACAANDNEDFPLLAVLRRDGRDDFIRLVTRYRKLVALCNAQPLQGLDYGHSSGGQPEYVTQKLKGDTAPEVAIDAAHAAGWPDETVPGGELRYKGVRKVKPHGETPATHAVAATKETRVRTAPLAVKFNDTVLLSQIDSKPILAELRVALGPLVDPFEDAVLGARTFTAIGAARGYEVKPDVAEGAGVRGSRCARPGLARHRRPRAQACQAYRADSLARAFQIGCVTGCIFGACGLEDPANARWSVYSRRTQALRRPFITGAVPQSFAR